MSVFEKIEEFVRHVFKTTVEVFFEALKLSPNAQGYVSGSITELLLKQHLEERGFSVLRVKEKWEGVKHRNHHGDFYFKGQDSALWYVLESKGVKSNSEKWHKLYNVDHLTKFMFAHSEKICWLDHDREIEPQIAMWIDKHLPKFRNEFADTLYDYEQVKKYVENKPKRETEKSRAINLLKNLTRDEINAQMNERLDYLMSKIKVLETHFVSGTSGSSERTQATPRRDEFNLVSIDTFLRYSEHRFLFANPSHLEPSRKDPDHLQQNYVIGFVFNEDGEDKLSLSEEWLDGVEEACETLAADNAVRESDMQIDNRSVFYSE